MSKAMDEKEEISRVIGVWPLFSSTIDVEEHDYCYYILLPLIILFSICWIIAVCNLVDLDMFFNNQI